MIISKNKISLIEVFNEINDFLPTIESKTFINIILHLHLLQISQNNYATFIIHTNKMHFYQKSKIL